MKKSLFVFFSVFAIVVYSQESDSVYSQESDSIKSKNTFLLFKLGIVYPEIEFLSSSDEKQLEDNAFNISNNRFALGVGGDIVKQLGYILTFSNNRYDIRTLYNGGESNSQYFVDYLALDANLTLRLSNDEHFYQKKWTPYFKGGFSYNYLVAGFQELNNRYLENLKENDDFTDQIIDFNIGLFLRRKLTENTQFWLGYNYKNGIMENENISNQKYSINTHTVSLGFSVYSDALKRQKRLHQQLVDECKSSIDSLRSELLYLIELKEKTMNDEWKAFVTPDKNSNSPLRDEIKSYVDVLFADNKKKNIEDKLVVLFPTNNDQYYNIFQRDLNDLIFDLAKNPPKTIYIVGYADKIGEDESNLGLSMRRAETVKDFLIVNGIDPQIISYDYHGETEEFDEIMLISNRRVEIYIER